MKRKARLLTAAGSPLRGLSLRGLLAWGALAAAALVIPPFLSPFAQILLTEILIWGLFAVSFDLLFGFTGLLSLGQSVYFGLGGFSLALLLSHGPANLWLAIPVSLGVTLAASVMIGFLAIRVGQMGFIIMTAISAMIMFLLASHFQPITGGDAGIVFLIPTLSFGFFELEMGRPLTNFYFILTIVAASLTGLWLLLRSSTGRVFLAIRENEALASLLGYNILRYKLCSFVIAGMTAGLAGALYCLTLGFVNQEFLHWTVSGDAAIWALIGGSGTLAGPMLGSAVLIVLKDYLSSWWPHSYPLVVGGLMILTAMYAPKGLMGLIRAVMKRHE